MRTKRTQPTHFGVIHGLVRVGHFVTNPTPKNDRKIDFNHLGFVSVRQAKRFMRTGATK
jgi:hypothetical protein